MRYFNNFCLLIMADSYSISMHNVTSFSSCVCGSIHIWTVLFYKIKCDKTIPFHSGPFRRIMTSCIYTVMPIVGYGFYCTPYFTAYPLLGMYLLITYTYKRMCFLTRVYTGRVNIVMRSYSASAVCWFYATDFWFL